MRAGTGAPRPATPELIYFSAALEFTDTTVLPHRYL
jgi:hypothetical protein